MSINSLSQSKLIIWYSLTIFSSSAILLVIEMTAGRIIAPYVGVSLYSWTSIIGVILGGISLGNWIGGRLADQGYKDLCVGIILTAAGIFCLSSLLTLTIVAPILQSSQLDLISSSFIYVLSMFFVPSLFLGIVTPMLTTLALQLDTRTGHIVGRMHALAALGSIIGTFATGFWLIQYFGSRAVIISASICLFILAVPFFRQTKKLIPVTASLVTLVLSSVIYVRDGFTTPCDKESNYFCLRVIDVSKDAPFGTARALILDHLMHGINHETEPDMLMSPYVHLMDEIIQNYFDETRINEISYFFAGGGAYTQPRAIKTKTPAANIVVAELDKAVTEIARSQLYFDADGIHVLHEDARTALKRLRDRKFDVIVTDVFHDVAIPYHLLTVEFIELVKNRLQEDGIYAINIVDVFPDPKLVKASIKTLQQHFKFIDVWTDSLPQQPTRMTYVISASNRHSLPDMIRSRQGFDRSWYRINVPLMATGTKIESLPVFSDNFVPVERMVAKLLFGKEGK